MKNNWLRGIALGSALLIILSANGMAQVQYSELLKTREMIWKAWFANDQATLEKILPKEVIAIDNGQDKWEHRDEVLRSAKQYAADGGKLISFSFPHVEVQSFSNVAIVYSLWKTKTEEHGKRVASSGRATEIFVHCNGQWLNAGWHLDSGK